MPWGQRSRVAAGAGGRRARVRAGLLLAGLGFASAVAAAVDPPDIQRVLKLLAGVGSEYAEAFDEQGALVRPIDIDEAHLLLDEVRTLTAPLQATDPAMENLVEGLTSLVDARVPPVVVGAYAEVVRRYVIRATGIHEDIVPPERPSLARGRELFQENCTGCHGATGAGDGADAARLGVTPARFTDRAFMRGETPRDAFNVITLGRQKSGMPAWGDALSAQQVWDLVGYVWSLARTPAEVSTGQRIYAERCAGCHGANGDPATAQATALDRPARSFSGLLERGERPDDAIFAVVSNGVPKTAMPAFASVLDDDERWAVVSFVRTLSLEGAPGAAAEPMEPDHAAEMIAVRRLAGAALDAHRRGDPTATKLATNAYLRFEPLEKFVAEHDEARVEALEASFVAFQLALQDPSKGDPETLGHQLEADLDGAAEQLRPSGLPGPALRGRGLLLTLGVGLVLLGLAQVIRMVARRPVATPGSSS